MGRPVLAYPFLKCGTCKERASVMPVQELEKEEAEREAALAEVARLEAQLAAASKESADTTKTLEAVSDSRCMFLCVSQHSTGAWQPSAQATNSTSLDMHLIPFWRQVSTHCSHCSKLSVSSSRPSRYEIGQLASH